VVVRASTRATVYAFLSTAIAAASTRSAGNGAERKKAIVETLVRILATVSALWASVRVQSSVVMIVLSEKRESIKMARCNNQQLPNDYLANQGRQQLGKADVGSADIET
jgi:hypothetical protein